MYSFFIVLFKKQNKNTMKLNREEFSFINETNQDDNLLTKMKFWFCHYLRLDGKSRKKILL